MTNKIKAINPQIVVHGTVDKPYYEISYFDTRDKKWHIGYSSYVLENVVKWLSECFEAIETDTEPVKHAHNANEKYHSVDEFRCSECGIHIEDWTTFFEDEDDGEHIAEYEFRYCPNCGARMDGDAYKKGMCNDR